MRSLQHEWSFLPSVVPVCGALFQELELVLGSAFLPALFGVEISAVERDLFSLPLRMGDLAVVNPVTAAPQFYDSSLSSTASLVKLITGVATFELDAHIETVSLSRDQGRVLLAELFSARFDSLLPQLDVLQQCTVLRAKEFNLSRWLSVLPLQRNQFDLSAQEFWDALALRYRKPLLGLPANCDGCGSSFTVDHALDCRFRGLVTCRHNEVRDAIGDLASLVWGQVSREPIVCEATAGSQDTLVADLAVRGVWQPQCEALFDKESEFFLYRLGDFLAAHWERPFGLVMGWIRARLSFAILRATLLCVRGSCTKWRCLGITDGASLPLLAD